MLTSAKRGALASTLAALLALTGVPLDGRAAGAATPTVAAPADAPPAGAPPAGAPPAGAPADQRPVLKALARLTEWMQASGVGAIETAGPPVVVDRAGAEVVRLPGLVWRSADATLSFGDVEVTRADAGNGRWRLTGALPAQLTVQAPGALAMVMTTGASAVDIVVDPGTGIVWSTSIEASDVAAVMEPVGRATIAGVAIRSDVLDGAGGKALLTSGYRLDGLVISAAPDAPGGSPTELARFGSIGTDARMDGVDWPRLVEMQAFLIANPAGLADGGEPARHLQSMLTTPDLIMDGAAFRFGVEDARIGEAAGGPMSVARLEFHAGVSGLAGGSAAGSIGYGHDGLKILLPLPVDGAAVPESFGLELAVERIPGRDLLDLLGAGGGTAAGDWAAVDEAALLALLQRAGTTARVSGARIRMAGMGADLDAEIQASATAPDGIAGRLVLTVVNLDRIVAALGPLITDELAAVQLAAVLGQRAEAPDGTVTHRWAMTRDPDGRSTLNGNDVSALVGDHFASLGRSLGSPSDRAPSGGSGTPAAGDGISAAFLAARLEEFGLGATVAVGASGETTVSADLADSLEGLALEAQFFDCAADGACGNCMLYLGVEPDQQVPLARINEWNSGERWVRAYRGENRAVWLELDIPGEGASAAAVDAAIRRFLDAAERFVADMAPDR